ncbi:MAG: transglycosylase SLT domain-containing protein [Candidatus Riflebacteria bacterium]|nr:transglycosylase SLT domain-containing protein [Candidatus Riflebacteria bacterium]
MRSQGKHAALVQKLSSSTSRALDDFRMYLLAESLKDAGSGEQAITAYSKLLKQYPDSWYSKKAGLNYVLLKAKNNGTAAYDELYKIALSLPTAFQRGRALEELILIAPSGQASKTAWESVMEYRSNSSFYQDVKETEGVFKKIYSAPTSWQFSAEQWINLLRISFGVGFAETFINNANSFSHIAAPGYHSLLTVLQADALRVSGKKEKAFQLLNTLIDFPSLKPAVKAFARQVRGDLLHFSNRHSEAVADLESAVAWGKAPVEIISANYRLMRSAFEIEQDEKALIPANWLVKNAPKISLLPTHLFEMGRTRYDTGRTQAAIPWLMLMSNSFPGHYRADDALGYVSIALGSTSDKGREILETIAEKYPNSFFLYWLAPDYRERKLRISSIDTQIPEWVKKRSAAWKLLLSTSFAEIAREEMRNLTDSIECDSAVFHAIINLMTECGDYQQLVAYGERIFSNTLNAGRMISDLPAWAWKAQYPRAFWDKVSIESAKYNIDPYWVLSIMREESHFNPTVRSRSNALCLMQILPSTGKWIMGKMGEKGKFREDMLWEIPRNIRYGVWYLNYLRDLFGGDMFLAAASYNGGQGNIKRKVEEGPYKHLAVLSRLDRVPLPETRDYYKKVMGAWWNYTRIYR